MGNLEKKILFADHPRRGEIMFTGCLLKEHDLIDCSYASDCLEKREKVQKCPLAVPLACSYLSKTLCKKADERK